MGMASIDDVAAEKNGVVRIAALGDTHYHRRSRGALVPMFGKIARRADMLLLAGDLTHNGMPEEAQVLARDLNGSLKIPVIAVLGNHDFESGRADDVQQVLWDAGVVVLDGESREVLGIGIAGVKGFGGGFERHMLTSWGESAIKGFVHEAVNEALKLEAALSRLDTPVKLALLHYSPIRSTVDGEPPEVFPFTGCSRLEEPLDRFEVSAAFHGHAHHGNPIGRTKGGVEVRNVAMPVLRRAEPELLPFIVIERDPSGERADRP